MTTRILLALTLWLAATGARAGTDALYERWPLPGPMIGLVEVPALFACEGCDGEPQAGATVALREAPDAAARVVARIDADRTAAAEYSYETAGAIVLERRDGWFRIAHRDGSGWIGPADARAWFPLDSLLRPDWAHATADWDGMLAASPGGRRAERRIATPDDEPELEIVDRRTIAGVLWLEVRVVAGNSCEEGTPVQDLPTVARGWLTAVSSSGRPAVWFHSRGC